MGTKGIKILLMASLAINLAVGTRIAYNHLQSKKPQPKKEFRNQLNLNEGQKQKLKPLIKAFKLKLAQYKQDILSKRIEIIEALSDPEVNIESLGEQLDELNELENELNTTFVETLLQMNPVFDSKQWLDLLYKMGKNWFFAGGSF